MPATTFVEVATILAALSCCTAFAAQHSAAWHFEHRLLLGKASKIATGLEHVSPVNVVGRHMHATQEGLRRTRSLLQSNQTGLTESIDVDANSYIEAYEFIATTDVTGYNLLPLAGFCGLVAQLDQGVSDCASTHHVCCIDASNLQASVITHVTNMPGPCLLP